MGREIRRVPPNWGHPKKDNGDYKPLYDESFEEAAKRWKDGLARWEAREDELADPEDYEKFEYWEWNDVPPDREYYRPNWLMAEASWYQVYENVSEGTPVTPPFSTQQELIKYLVNEGTSWDKKPWSKDAAEKFVMGAGWLPSMVTIGGGFLDLTQQPLPFINNYPNLGKAGQSWTSPPEQVDG